MQDCVRHVRLEVVAPRAFYDGSSHGDLFSRMHNALARFANAQTNAEWSMSLQALVFPDSFGAVPFASGKDVKEWCMRCRLSPKGRSVRDAFANLAPVWSARACLRVHFRWRRPSVSHGAVVAIPFPTASWLPVPH